MGDSNSNLISSEKIIDDFPLTINLRKTTASSSKSHLPVSPQPTTTSNYNVNLIPCETTEKKYLTSSASENLIKESPYKKQIEKRQPKGKVLYDDDADENFKFIKKREGDRK